jgi:hypothetical protein
VPWHSEHLDAYAVLGLGVWFTVLCLLTIWCVVHDERIAKKQRVFLAPAMASAQIQLQ